MKSNLVWHKWHYSTWHTRYISDRKSKLKIYKMDVYRAGSWRQWDVTLIRNLAMLRTGKAKTVKAAKTAASKALRDYLKGN